MSKNHLDHPVIGVFDDTYRVPNDQLDFEFNLRDEFGREFPENVALLDEALVNVQRVSGITIPIPGIADPDGELKRSGLVDEFGQFMGRPDWCRLTLGLERSDLDAGDGLPEATLKMLAGMYSLLGASVTSDGFWAKRGSFFRREAIRQGSYYAVPVHVHEIFQLLRANQQDGGLYTFSVSVYNETYLHDFIDRV